MFQIGFGRSISNLLLSFIGNPPTASAYCGPKLGKSHPDGPLTRLSLRKASFYERTRRHGQGTSPTAVFYKPRLPSKIRREARNMPMHISPWPARCHVGPVTMTWRSNRPGLRPRFTHSETTIKGTTITHPRSRCSERAQPDGLVAQNFNADIHPIVCVSVCVHGRVRECSGGTDFFAICSGRSAFVISYYRLVVVQWVSSFFAGRCANLISQGIY